MFNTIQPKESTATSESSLGLLGNKFEENFPESDYEDNENPEAKTPEIQDTKKTISVGDSLPYGIRLYYETSENIVRMKDIGVKNRILVLGVIGSFTPYCWNRHLFRVLEKLSYFEERHIDYICCVSTNDAQTQRAWASYLGCEESVLMLADVTTRYTKAIGMDVIIPWLDNRIRSKRYIIYAEDMIVLKMLVASQDGPYLSWDCEHFKEDQELDKEVNSETSSSI